MSHIFDILVLKCKIIMCSPCIYMSVYMCVIPQTRDRYAVNHKHYLSYEALFEIYFRELVISQRAVCLSLPR
jgi:hypothetical protein